ncbi:uncharacterized protein LOC131956098 [Physella acuta]|uniref:uncharacterized protein LOC131956098 n=1 Tax=Physella acuta TaxID=109671 RepID=UPI0027DC93A9|nr:uncharacterized protein LOC131956098 [Physella acuta]
MSLALLTLLIASLCHVTEARSATNALLNVCERRWELIYSHDQYGNTTLGSKKELIVLAMSGNSIKANLYMPDHVLQLPADNINRRDNEICFQSLRALANNGSHIDTSDPWLFYAVCTTGHVTERDLYNTSVFRVAIDWFVKDIGPNTEPIYSNFFDGCPLKESSLGQLHEAAKCMNLLLSMRDKPYVFPLHNVLLDPVSGEVSGQNLMHMGQSYLDNYISFHHVPYKWFSYWSNTGHRDNVRWSVQKNVAYKHNTDTAALDWYADVCWRHIYTNDENGYPVHGSVEDLINAVRRGHRVRVRYDNIAMEVSNIRVKGQVVAAQLLNEITLAKDSGSSRIIERMTRVRISIVHTTGRIQSHEYLIGTDANRKINVPIKRRVEWMVDTRPWTVVLKTVDPPGDAIQGSTRDLELAIQHGASIRLNIELDPLAGSFFTQANNIRADLLSETVYAQALDHVSDKKARTPDEYELQLQLFSWYLVISSRGQVRMSAWMYGTDSFRYDEGAPEATVTWFANL